MLTNAQELIATNPLLAIYPGAIVFLAVISCNLLGDALHKRLDRRRSSPAMPARR
jgi:peptide/nickel transport system permease protein